MLHTLSPSRIYDFFPIAYLVVYPPFAKIVCPVIQRPEVHKKVTMGAISATSVSRPSIAMDLWNATASSDS